MYIIYIYNYSPKPRIPPKSLRLDPVLLLESKTMAGSRLGKPGDWWVLDGFPGGYP